MNRMLAAMLVLTVAACGSGDAPPKAGAEEKAKAQSEASEPRTAAKAESGTPPCLFRRTSGWRGSIEGGRLLVTGTVDIQMAGMKPQLTQRSGGAGGVAAFDLALVPEPGAVVSTAVRLEKSGSPRYSRGEIHCGGERIAEFDIVNI